MGCRRGRAIQFADLHIQIHRGVLPSFDRSAYSPDEQRESAAENHRSTSPFASKCHPAYIQAHTPNAPPGGR